MIGKTLISDVFDLKSRICLSAEDLIGKKNVISGAFDLKSVFGINKV